MHTLRRPRSAPEHGSPAVPIYTPLATRHLTRMHASEGLQERHELRLTRLRHELRLLV